MCWLNYNGLYADIEGIHLSNRVIHYFGLEITFHGEFLSLWYFAASEMVAWSGMNCSFSEWSPSPLDTFFTYRHSDSNRSTCPWESACFRSAHSVSAEEIFHLRKWITFFCLFYCPLLHQSYGLFWLYVFYVSSRLLDGCADEISDWRECCLGSNFQIYEASWSENCRFMQMKLSDPQVKFILSVYNAN